MVLALVAVVVVAPATAVPEARAETESPVHQSLGRVSSGPDGMPFIGDAELWCTMSNPGAGGFCGRVAHHGYWAIDIGMPVGTTVIATGAGTVADLCAGSCTDGRGLFVELLHPDGFRSRYLHLSSVSVTRGQQVAMGQTLGLSGNTGASTAPHLHYDERSPAGVLVDPGLMRACVGGQEVIYPPAGFSSWLDTPYGTRLRHDGGTCGTGAPVQTADPARYVAVTPTRLLDTRSPGPLSGILGPRGQMVVPVGGHAGVPADAVAVVANVTVTDAQGPGFLTLWPTGELRPTTSSLNHRSAETVGNLVVARLGTGGSINVYAHAGAHVIIDVQGYYEPVASASAGRLVTLAPTRLFDTRTAAAPHGVVGPRGTITVAVRGRAGVPASGVSAVVVNLAATQTLAGGFVTAWSGGNTTRPAVSTLNVAAPGTTATNLAIVPVAPDGTISVYSHGGAHLVADVYGYLTDASAPNSTSGLFVALGPERAFDTRTAAAPFGPVRSGTSTGVTMAGRGAVPQSAGAVAMNLTGTEAAGAGFVTVWPSDQQRPLVSALNLPGTGATRANATLAPLAANGSISVFANTDTHVVADVVGYYLR